MNRLSLDGSWKAKMCAPGYGEERGWQSGGFDEDLAATVPGHIQRDLIEAGLLPDYNVSDNVLRYGEIEGNDWWFARSFQVPELSTYAELWFGGTDSTADVWLDGIHVGTHLNAHDSWAIDVTNALHAGLSTLVVRLDDGTRRVAQRAFDTYMPFSDTNISHPQSASTGGPFPNQRMFVRKPQYVWGWDHSPRLLACGIWRNVELRTYESVVLRDVYLQTQFIHDGTARVTATFDVEFLRAADHARVELTLTRNDTSHQSVVELAAQAAGRQIVHVDVDIADPELWWPAPLGDAALYECTASVSTGQDSESKSIRYGIRSITIDQQPQPGGMGFTFLVNGKHIFCKGSCWQPPDMLYGNISQSKLRELISAAANANFNMIRINGIGTYESDQFYDLCDEFGILVWQDFPFACAYYPDDDPEFCELIRVEAETAIRRLRNHASLALWCGNNEIQWLHSMAMQSGQEDKPFPNTHLFDELLPQLCRELDSDRPYWPGSPWGGDLPNSEATGDRHAWDYTLLRDTDQRLHYDDIHLDRSAFVSEFGILGPSDVQTLSRVMDASELAMGSPIWRLHENLFENDVTDAAIRRYIQPNRQLSVEDWVLAGQLVQAEGLGAALRHWRRRRPLTSGVITWGYEDCWAAATSWSIVDYYGRSRAAYHHVRRAFEPIQVSLASDGPGMFAVWIINDLQAERQGHLEIGYVNVLTADRFGTEHNVRIAADSARHETQIDLPATVRRRPEHHIIYATLSVDGEVVSRARETLVGSEFSRLQIAHPKLTVVSEDGDHVLVQAQTFAFQVHSERSDPLSGDDWFDMLPGETRLLLPGTRSLSAFFNPGAAGGDTPTGRDTRAVAGLERVSVVF